MTFVLKTHSTALEICLLTDVTFQIRLFGSLNLKSAQNECRMYEILWKNFSLFTNKPSEYLKRCIKYTAVTDKKFKSSMYQTRWIQKNQLNCHVFKLIRKNIFKRNALVLFLCLSKSWMKSKRGSLLAKEKVQQTHSTVYHRIREWVGLEKELKHHPASTEIYWYNYVTKSKMKSRPPFKSLISGKVFNNNWFSGIGFRKMSLVPANKQGSSFSHTNPSQLSLREKLCNNITSVY